MANFINFVLDKDHNIDIYSITLGALFVFPCILWNILFVILSKFMVCKGSIISNRKIGNVFVNAVSIVPQIYLLLSAISHDLFVEIGKTSCITLAISAFLSILFILREFVPDSLLEVNPINVIQKKIDNSIKAEDRCDDMNHMS